MKLLLSGQAQAPIKCSSDVEVKKAVSSNSNAIGFVLSNALDDTIQENFRVE